MGAKLKPLSEQVIVVAGAATPVGAAIARLAAEAGSAVVLIDREEAAVRKIAAEINAEGGRAHPVKGEATDAEEAARLARAAIARFSGFDTWINVAPGDLAAANTAREAARHYSQRGGAVIDLAAGGRASSAGLRRELNETARVSLTHIALPKGFAADTDLPAAAKAALYAAANPVSRMTVAGPKRLTVLTEAQKHRGVVIGLGLLGLAAAAAWFGRGAVGDLAKPALRKSLTKVALRHPLTVAKLAAKHPRQSFKVAKFALR